MTRAIDTETHNGGSERIRDGADRVFVHIPGYYPLSPDASKRRFEREYERFLNAWSATGSFGEMQVSESWASWPIRTGGADWSTRVEHILFRWEDIIDADRSRNWFARVGLGILTFIDFVINGALYRYLRHAWRYSLFFLYPFLMIALLFTVSLWGVRGGLYALGLTPVPWALDYVAGGAIFFAILHAVGVRLKLDHLLDDWIYGRAIVRRPDAAVEARLSLLADRLNAEQREVLIVGHSFGAVLGARLVAMMIERRPDGPPVRFASVGSSILKIGFNSAARPLHAAVSQIASSDRVIWHDFTALNDGMNFYLVEPVAALGVAGRPAYARRVRFRGMVSPEYYEKMERDLFRLHNQFISGNDFRASYDYFMLMCGPWPMEIQSESPQGVMSWIDETGALTKQGRALPLTP